ncbi:hypothetical protein K502DRAFT_351644 [Neoconidiobolus thromboides FSU 785]|nr:hypothetical protein K502DRAFT_351644 [Neoconidiobolus thromboides FSU 785]
MKLNFVLLFLISNVYPITKEDLLNKLKSGDLTKISLDQQELGFIQKQGVPIQINDNGEIKLNGSRQLKEEPRIDVKSKYPIRENADNQITKPLLANLSSDSDTCFVGGMQHMPCKGFCPRCWKKESYGYSCFDYSKASQACPFPEMINKGNDLPPQNVNYFKGKSCFIAGVVKNVCSFGDKGCPKCWVIDYKSQNFDCYQPNSFSGKCDNWEGMTDISQLK